LLLKVLSLAPFGTKTETHTVGYIGKGWCNKLLSVDVRVAVGLHLGK